MSEKVLYLMVGAPGSGKSYYARKYAKEHNIEYVSRDDIRFSLLKDGEDYFSHENDVFNMFIAAIKTCLNTTNSCIADATHLNAASREKVINAVEKSVSDFEVIPIVMNTSLSECIARNQLREGRERVPDGALRRMFYSISPPYPGEHPRMKEALYVVEEE